MRTAMVLSGLEVAGLAVLGLWALGLLLWALGAWRARQDAGEPLAAEQLPATSVIVAARNAAATLPALLADLAAQAHPALECVVVDDRSSDATPELLSAWVAQAPERRRWLRIDHTPAGWTGKKWALTEGIAAARHDVLLFTDADCRVGPTWAQHMTAPLAADARAELVLGLSPLAPAPTLLSAVQRYENAWFGLQLLGCVGWGRPVLALGRNLAYRRALYARAGGHAAHAQLLSGDDDLLVARAAAPGRTRCVVHPQAQALTEAPASWGAYVRQRRRHVSTSTRYPWGAQAAFGLWGALELLLPLGGASLALLLHRLGAPLGVGALVAAYAPGLLRVAAVASAGASRGAQGALWAALSPLVEALRWALQLRLLISLLGPGPRRWS